MRARSVYLMLAAAVAGGAGMSLEMAASRFLLPYYGDARPVWANLIGLVLLALSLGYYVGGALADRRPSARPPALALLAAAGWTAGIPRLGPLWLRYLQRAMPAGDAGYLLGSFLAVAALLAIPMLLLGLVPPYVIRLLLKDVRLTGELAGRVYAVSTVGSLVGTLAPVLWLMPAYGIRATFGITAGVLAVVGALGLATKAL